MSVVAGGFKPSLSERKCANLKMINRVPESVLEDQLQEMGRERAKMKLETKYREMKLWDELYRYECDLKNSFVSK